jgi:hypothetical protein
MNLSKNLSTILVALGAVVIVAQPVGAIEKPAFELIEETGELQIRRYQPLIVARTLVNEEFDDAGNEGFRRLAGYIFGGNVDDQKIAMTAPVGLSPAENTEGLESSEKKAYWITFSMPGKYDMDTLPIPDDPRVELVQEPERYIAVVRYKGGWAESRFRTHEAKLLALVDELSGWKKKGEVTWARYNPPIVPGFLKTNEVAIEVVPTSDSQ